MEAVLIFVLSMTKLGRKISEGNAGVYSLYKSLIGIRILFPKQMFATLAWILFTILRT